MVYRCVHHKTREVRAVKRINTSDLHPRDIAHEIAMMKILRDSNIVHCYDVFLDAQYVNVVIDMFAGGDLVDGLHRHYKNRRGPIPGNQLAHLTRQMVAAVVHVHNLNIVHRDIKGENFLSNTPDIGDPDCHIALSDFGTAIRLRPDEKLTHKVGTTAFWAPEVWHGSYSHEVDIWGLGITTYVLLTGALPFDGEEAICRPVEPGKRPFPVRGNASAECLDFIEGCLDKDPARRWMAASAAEHIWLTSSNSRLTTTRETVVSRALRALATRLCCCSCRN